MKFEKKTPSVHNVQRAKITAVPPFLVLILSVTETTRETLTGAPPGQTDFRLHTDRYHLFHISGSEATFHPSCPDSLSASELSSLGSGIACTPLLLRHSYLI